ncbi:uncharacterized protein [Ptychodera flava]|uniref:uncharacterized protein n=1 Tax=Ptychodera flava TaxID=63121 RepID=UPI003969D9A5
MLRHLLREILLPRDTNPQEQKENIEISTLPHDVTSHQCCHCSGTVVPSVSDATTQTDLDGIIVAVSKDHGYATNLPVTADRLRGNSSDGTTSQGTTTDSGGESQMDTEGDALDNHTCDTFDDSDSDASDEDMSEDPDFIPYTSSSETDSEYSDTEPDIIIDDPVSSDPAEQMKFLVFESSLIELFTKCQRKDCPAQVISMQKLLSGSRLIIKTTCSAGCHYSWSSQPTLNKMGAGNLLLSAAILFSGNTYTRLYDIAHCLHMPIVGETQFYNIQKKYLFPVVNETWLSMQNLIINDLRGRDNVLCGDGRCDSPGHCAKYCTYTLMDEETGYIVDFCVNSVADPSVKNSNAMEPMGLRKCLDFLKKMDVPVSVLASDRHITIRKIMRLEYPEIEHQFDIWHLVKSVIKRLCAVGKVKGNSALLEWIQSISNHFWWCAESCRGDVNVLREKWQSVVYHTVDIHSWDDKEYFHACEHEPISEGNRKEISWLRVGSPPHDALRKVVNDKKLLKDLEHITLFCHTGELEVYHSLLLKYTPKRQHFSHEGMVCRTQLAVIDHNYHVAREQATTKSGSLCFKVVYPKSHSYNKKWIAKIRKERKTYPYRESMMKEVVAMRVKNQSKLHADIPNLKSNIAPIDKPCKHDVIERTFQFTWFASENCEIGQSDLCVLQRLGKHNLRLYCKYGKVCSWTFHL